MAIDSVSYSTVMNMTDEELHNQLITKLNLHIKGILPHSIEQEPYKLDIFWIFKALNKRKRKPRYFVDGVLNVIMPKLDSTDITKRDNIIQQVQSMWKEWVFCWQHGVK